MKRALALAIFALAAASAPAMLEAGTARPGLSAGAARGLAFAQMRCAACHGVTVDASSPNPEAPPFEDVANRTGLTQGTMREFLRDSHNYPEAMNFTVEPAQVNDLAAYFVSLRRRGYRPGI